MVCNILPGFRDDQGRNHLLEITLPMNYPSSPPCLVAVYPARLAMLLSHVSCHEWNGNARYGI